MNITYQDKYASVDGIRIRYWDEGEGDVLLLIPGTGVTIETWFYNIDHLINNGYRVITFDVPGFGRSSRPTNDQVYALSYVSEFIHSFVTGHGVTRVSVLGNSLGGMLAIQFALDYPSMVDNLVLVDSTGLGRGINLGMRIMSIRPIGEFLVKINRRFVERYTKTLLYRDDLVTTEFVDLMLEMALAPGTKEAFLRTLRTGVNIRGQKLTFAKADLRGLKLPVLVVWGEQDPALPVTHARDAIELFPNCRTVIFDRAGHAPQMDRPNTFNKLVVSFLSQEDGAHTGILAPGSISQL